MKDRMDKYPYVNICRNFESDFIKFKMAPISMVKIVMWLGLKIH